MFFICRVGRGQSEITLEKCSLNVGPYVNCINEIGFLFRNGENVVVIVLY